jgi:hypothetical protein
MRQGILTVAVCLLFPAILPAGNLIVQPTTTLQEQTSNNTSAADSFQSQTNGNLGATNVSKVDLHSLLYVGATTQIYAHFMPWFGDPRHMAVGYNSQDPAQVHRQITDMISRGIDGMIIDWYGSRDTFTNTTTLRVMAEAEKHPSFKFAIMIDKGAIKLSACPGCTPQQTLIEQIHYVEKTFIPSPAYMHISGRPMITNFDVELHYPSVDWAAAAATTTTNPIFIFENASGFTHGVTGGSYSWVMPSTTDFGMAYMTKFYDAGLASPKLETIGASYKGFNDTLASWGLNRIMTQRCGHTWLDTFAKVNSLYNSTNQLDALQLPTWNDYEEGTEVESGIDNCMSVAAVISKNVLQWSVSSYEDTLDHYVVYISTDGQNLMPLNTMGVGSHSLDLCSYSPQQRQYTLYVQGGGKPTIRNRMSGAVSYTPSCAGTSASIRLGASPSVLQLKLGSSTSSKITVTPVAESFSNAVVLSCSGLPVGVSCSFAPSSVTPGARAVTSKLTIATAVSAPRDGRTRSPWRYAFWLPGFVVMGVAVAGGWSKHRRMSSIAGLLGLALMTSTLVSCGNGGNSHQPTAIADTQNQGFTIAINGTSGNQNVSTSVVLTIQ